MDRAAPDRGAISRAWQGGGTKEEGLMLLRRFPIACLSLCFACWIALLASAAPQERYDRDGYARDYVKFLVLQLDQWSKEFPHQFHLALVKPPVDSSKLSEAAKAGASEL